MEVIVEGPVLGKSFVCEPILCSLPQWFGIEEANAQYIRDIEVLPTFIALVDDDAIGFLTLKQHNEYSAEIHVMGVTPRLHRKGVGRALLTRAEEYLQGQGVEYLQVKTLSDTHPDANYARTRAFYMAMGFRPLEEFKTLWNEENPCLLMVKSVRA
jgi:GNAT superfamily N-acetyltransferase